MNPLSHAIIQEIYGKYGQMIFLNILSMILWILYILILWIFYILILWILYILTIFHLVQKLLPEIFFRLSETTCFLSETTYFFNDKPLL